MSDKEEKVAVRVIKRPFLPSRGGNPYKPRGLQPVGILAQHADDEAMTASLTENTEDRKITLEDLYNEEYDVDLNDALNPMLKPLTSSRGVSEQNRNNNNLSFGNSNEKDVVASQSQKAGQQKVAEPSSTPSTINTTEQPEYYDDELEYTYADDVV